MVEVRSDGVMLSNGDFVPSELVVWAAGVKGPGVLAALDGLEVSRNNQLVVTPTLANDARPQHLCDGRLRPFRSEGATRPVPPRAQAAHQQASHLVRQMRRRLAGQPLEPWRYRSALSSRSVSTARSAT